MDDRPDLMLPAVIIAPRPPPNIEFGLVVADDGSMFLIGVFGGSTKIEVFYFFTGEYF